MKDLNVSDLFANSYPFETNTDVRRGILTTFQSVAGCTVVVFLLIPQMFFFAISYYLAKIIDDLKMIIAKIDRVCDETETVTEYLVELVLLHQRVLRSAKLKSRSIEIHRLIDFRFWN